MIRIYLQEFAKGILMVSIIGAICFITFGSV